MGFTFVRRLDFPWNEKFGGGKIRYFIRDFEKYETTSIKEFRNIVVEIILVREVLYLCRQLNLIETKMHKLGL